jgi:high-affinity nickel-transport protein
LLTMILSVRPELHGPFWKGVEVAGDKYDIIGGAICGAFVVFGGLAFVIYRPWRRRVDCWREVHAPALEDQEGGGYADDGNEGLDSRAAVGAEAGHGKANVLVDVRGVEDGGTPDGAASRS